MHLFQSIGGGGTPDPEANRESRIAELCRVAAANLFQRADQRGRARELIERQEAERVAQDDRDPAALVLARLAAHSPQEEREGNQAEIRLGLSAARREVDQVRELAIRVRWVGDGGQVHQDERELERPPLGSLGLAVPGVLALAIGLERGDEHGGVGLDESLANRVVLGEERDALGDPRFDAIGFDDQRVARLFERIPIERRVSLLAEPLLVRLDERREGALQRVAVLELGEVPHAEHERRDRLVSDARDLVPRDLRGAQGPDLAVRIRHGLEDTGVVPDGPLLPIAEEQRQHALIIVGGRVLAFAIGPPAEAVRVMEREANLKDVVEVPVFLERDAVVDEKQAEHARARLEAVHVGGAELPLDDEPRRQRDTDALAEHRLIERHRDPYRPMRNALPPMRLLVLAIERDLDLVVPRIRDLDLDGIRPTLARRQVDAEPHRSREPDRPLRLRLLAPRIIRLALAPDRELAAVRIEIIRLGRPRPLRREKPGEVPPRRRQRERLAGSRDIVGIRGGVAGSERPDEIGLERSEETRADRAYLAAVDALSGSVLPFNPAPDDTVHAIKLTGSLLLVGGEFGEILGDSDVDGCAGIDTTTGMFYAGAGWVPESLSLTAGGNCYAINATTVLGATYILLGGDFTEVNTTSSPNFARVRVSTGLVLATAAQPNGTVYAIGITGGTSNRAVIGGTFTAIAGGAAGTGDNCRWLGAVVASSGAVADYDTQLSDSSGQNIGVRAITAVSGTVYVGGVFDTFIEDVDGAAVTTNPVNFVALTGNALPPLNEDTNIDALSAGTAILDTKVYALAADAAGVVCVGGSFMGVSQMTRNNAYALDDVDDADADYRQVTSWNPNVTNGGVAANAKINDIFIDSTGNAYITGLFDAIGATMKNSLSKTDGTTGAADAGFPSFDAATKEGDALAGDGTNLYVGGTFTDIGGMGGPRLAEITYAGVVNAAFPSAAVRVKALHIYNTILYVGLAGGGATALGGTDRAGAGAIDLTADSVMAWDPQIQWDNIFAPQDGEVYAFASDSTGVYCAGRIDYAKDGGVTHISHNVVLIEHATGGAAGNAITSFSTDGVLDWLLGGGGADTEMDGVVVQNGALYCTGLIIEEATGVVRGMAKFDALSGAIDTGYATSVWADQAYYGDPPIPMLFESSQGLIAGGYFSASSTDDAHYLGEFFYSSLTVADRSGGAIGNGESPSMDGIDTDFGDLDTNKRSQPLTITLSNAGGGTIDISAITLIGTDPTEFELDTSDTDMALTGSESTTFDVYFIPATGGNKSATVQIDHNDDTGAQPFTFDVEGTALTATMTVYETDANGLVITDGSGAPGEPTERDFGIVGVDAGISDPFVVYIENTGDGTLTLGIPSLGGNDPGEFLIGLGGFSTTVLAGATTQFSVYFNPTDNAYMRADVSFDCNDPAIASPFTFEVVGFGDEPALIVAVDGAAIGDGNTAPQFPDEFVGEISVDVMTVEVRNSGLSTLTVGIPFLDGVNPDQFSLDTTGYTTPLDFSENTQFTVTFAPTSAGAKTAEIHITHDDPTDGDGVFIFQILGDGISPSALSITTETELTATYPGAAYSTTLAASGGIPSYTWTKIGGVLPPGLSLSTSGQITGTVGDSAKGQYIFAAQVEDTLGDTVNRPFSINVVAPPLNITGIAPSGVGGCALDNDHSPGATWPLAGIMLAIIATAHTIRRQRTANLR
ncbi:MAG: choice-of-anchor D domain-containing protein [Planctomycetaceae bacterium]|nr:choice-of-anchor D domain-containing protein [Planctomycetaceae bacterium]